MCYRRFLVMLTLLGTIQSRSLAEDVRVTFKVVVPGTLSPLMQPYIASSVNGWSVSSPVWKMTAAGTNVFTLEITLAVGQSVEYYYTMGDRRCEETNADGASRTNRTLTPREGLVQLDTVAHWSMESVNAGRWLPQDVEYFQGYWLSARLGFTYPESASVDNPVRQIQSIGRLDSLLKVVRDEWKTESLTRYGGVLPNISSAWYPAVAALVNDRALAQSAKEFILEYYQFPAFIREYKDVRDSMNAENAKRLAMGLITLQFAIDEYWLAALDTLTSPEFPGLGSRHLNRRMQWEEVKTIALEVPALADRYLAKPAIVDDNTRSQLKTLKLMLEIGYPSLRIQDDIVNDRLRKAFRAFKRLSPYGKDGIGSNMYFHIGSVMFEALARRQQSILALEVLDSLYACNAQSFPGDTLLRVSYRKSYLRADARRGAARFRAAVARHATGITPVGPSSGSVTPILSGRYLDITSGDTVDLGTLRGKIVVFDFWTTSCGPCVAGIPELKKYAQELRSSNEAVLVSVLCDDAMMRSAGGKFLARFIQVHDVTYPALLEPMDRRLTRRFDISFFPSWAILNRQGEIALAPKDAKGLSMIKERVASLRAVQ